MAPRARRPEPVEGGPGGYPPDIAPTTRNGSAPVATASGSGVSGASYRTTRIIGASAARPKERRAALSPRLRRTEVAAAGRQPNGGTPSRGRRAPAAGRAGEAAAAGWGGRRDAPTALHPFRSAPCARRVPTHSQRGGRSSGRPASAPCPGRRREQHAARTPSTRSPHSSCRRGRPRGRGAPASAQTRPRHRA